MPAPTARTLTPREVAVLSAAARGEPIKTTARQLGVSPYAIDRQLASARARLGARSTTMAVAIAMGDGIIALDRP